MKKFVINSKKGTTSIYEVECEKILPLEDPSALLLPIGEYKARILKPTFFHEKEDSSIKAKLIPVVWQGYAFYDSLEAARAVAEKNMIYDMVEFAISKNRTPATKEEVALAIASIEVIYLIII